jgi:myo-inositol-1(or 4)-monophosphatase
MSDHHEALAVARAVVAEAVTLLDGAADKVGRISSKSSIRDLVTEWDTRVEELIRNRLAALSPGVPLVGEEAGGDGSAARRWLIDPIDGTVNFAHGLPLWAVTVAYEEAGLPVAGVVSAPVLGWEMWASAGGGAFMNDRRLQVSQVPALEQSILATGFPYDRAQTRTNFAEWEHLQCRAGACRRLGAASLDLALVARGALDGYWETRLQPWDVSAGALLVREAGGTVTDLTGGPFHSDRGALVATNGAIHEEVLAALAEVDRIVRHDS